MFTKGVSLIPKRSGSKSFPGALSPDPQLTIAGTSQSKKNVLIVFFSLLSFSLEPIESISIKYDTENLKVA